jgi:multidrug efflux pump subunit AcrA (membrane-fusion protein)
MRFLTRSLIGLFLVALTVGLLGYAGATLYGAVQARMSEEPFSRPARERIISVNVVTFMPETIQPELTVFGEVRSRRTLDIRAASGGRVIELSPEFAEGGRVTAGTVLARIDPVEAQSSLAVARADASEAAADLREADRALLLAQDELTAARTQAALRERALERQRDLEARGVGTAAAVEAAELAVSSANQAVLSRRQSLANAEARIDQARTTIERRQIALGNAERRLADTEIIASFDGTLAEVSVVEGRIVSTNDQIAQLIDPDALEVAFRVSTAQYARLLDDAGSLRDVPVRLTLDASGIDLTAESRISRESAAVGVGQTGRQLFAQLDGAPGFRPGDFVSVTIVEPALNRVARLPATAVDAAGNVLVIGEDQRLRTETVEILRRERDDVIVRARGLAGEDIVSERSPLLGSGIRVSPVRPGVGAEPEAPPEMLALEDDRRARLIAFVEDNRRLPPPVKARMLEQLAEPEVPAEMVSRLEGRMGS